ncbi:PadR family transcriptional regulator [Bacillus sp. CLL-7-23]|uniref:PadR family transcriptional regulator n=1 Tax=Bacillus changyiensis TaxID=3004103 RepID=A0ABT4X4Y1_9BACI|nr:PadR family transcriptional regulator [Bacillus changyiensis]MDA7027348.1 PadR family transcriptional regulator [Bacillus changyiensis]
MKGKHVILGLLMEKEDSGYDINETLKTVFSHFYDGSYAMIYPTLRKLEKEGEIEKKVVIQEGKPNKNVYSITQKGIQEFDKFLQSPIKDDVLQSDFHVRMYFGEYVTNEQVMDWIQKEIDAKMALINQLEENYMKWKPNLTETQKISFDMGIALYRSQIDVLNEKLTIFIDGQEGKEK